jgi:hypothetical protein
VTGNRAVEDAARAPESPRPGQSTTGGLAEGLAAHDFAVGLSRSGPLLAYVEEAAHESIAPDEGYALFDIGVDASGRVSVALLDASSDRGGWSDVGRDVERAVDVKRVRLPEGAGWRAVIRVDAAIVYPNGVSPKSLGTRVTARDGNLKFSTSGKICSFAAGAGIDGLTLGGGCDLANAGARPSRVVHGRIVQEGRF